MTGLILLFLILAIVASIFGFGGIVEAATGIALILFWVFIGLFILGIIYRLVTRR